MVRRMLAEQVVYLNAIERILKDHKVKGWPIGFLTEEVNNRLPRHYRLTTRELAGFLKKQTKYKAIKTLHHNNISHYTIMEA